MATGAERQEGNGRGVGTDHYARFVARIMRAYGRQAAAGELDPTALTQLVMLRDEVEQQIAATVTALRSTEGGSYSWSAVGEALGITREAAHRKFSRFGAGGRRPGGQPSALR